MRRQNISHHNTMPSKLRLLANSVVLVVTMLLSAVGEQANAVTKKEGGRCVLSAETLATPDLVVQDALENALQSSSKNCNDMGYSESATDFAHRGLKVFPIQGRKIPNAGWGIYRDFKIHGFQAGPDLEGSKTRIYDVELIYIAMTTMDSTVPLCERSRVPMRVVHTPWGWRFMNQFGFGSNLQAEIRATERKLAEAKNPAYRYSAGQISYLEKWSKEEIEQLNEFANRCKLKIN